MAERVIFRSAEIERRREPLLVPRSKMGEVAGGTAAVFCCCPCTVMNLVVLTVYKVPVGVCRKVWRKGKRRRLAKKKKALLIEGPTSSSCCVDDEECFTGGFDLIVETMDNDDDAKELEKEMWERFYGTGFWRSPSQRDA